MPTFDGKSDKFELFEDLFQTNLKIHKQLTEENKIDYFHSLMLGDALQTLKNITRPNRENFGEILTVFRRKYVKPKSMATATHKFQRLIFNPANQNLIDFLDKLQKSAKDAFGAAAQKFIEQFIYAKMPPHLKKSINQVHLENGTYEQIVSHLERELELNGLEAPHEMQKKHCGATRLTTKLWKVQTNLPPLQKARSLSKSVPPTQTRKRLNPK